jgi:hypothetical protein
MPRALFALAADSISGTRQITTLACSALLASISLLASPPPASAAVTIAGFTFDDDAGADEITLLPGGPANFTDCAAGIFTAPSLPALTPDQSADVVLTTGIMETWILGGATFDAAFIDNVIVNDAGPDLVVFEIGVTENFELAVDPGTGIFTAFQTFAFTATGFANSCTDFAPFNGINATTVDLSAFGIAPGASVSVIGINTLGSPDSFIGADIAGIFALNSAPAVPGPMVCPRTRGFWRNHPQLWPVASLELGAVTYSQAALLDLLAMPSKGDASLILAAQLIAAKLNVEAGSDPTPVDAAIADADALLAQFAGALPYGVSANSNLGADILDIKDVLDDYNNGLLTPEDCVE